MTHSEILTDRRADKLGQIQTIVETTERGGPHSTMSQDVDFMITLFIFVFVIKFFVSISKAVGIPYRELGKYGKSTWRAGF